jgi:hypothetical protein
MTRTPDEPCSLMQALDPCGCLPLTDACAADNLAPWFTCMLKLVVHQVGQMEPSSPSPPPEQEVKLLKVKLDKGNSLGSTIGTSIVIEFTLFDPVSKQDLETQASAKKPSPNPSWETWFTFGKLLLMVSTGAVS